MTESRIEIVFKQPNPLFEKWLQEWLNEAEQNNSKVIYTLKEALNSLKKFPLPLATGRDCAILRGFGSNLCQLIDQKLDEYKQTNINEYNCSINYDLDVQKITKDVQKTKCKVVATKKSPSKIKAKSKSKNDIKINDDHIIVMKPGSFKIIMLVDTQETTGKSKKTLDNTRCCLNSEKIQYDIRRLSVGDFLWICRDDKNNELTLPYIVERKRMDDFASSIRDGRFHEQKFRLRNCGLENVIYLIENYGNNQHLGLPLTTLQQAAVNTQIHSRFQVKFTNNHDDSLLYLAVLTRILIENFKNKTLISTLKENLKSFDLKDSTVNLLKFHHFQEASSKTKNVTVREIFIKQLLQLKSLSIDKALAITDLYPTPKLLFSAYKNCDSQEDCEKLLSKIQYGKLKRPVGGNISKIIYRFYCTDFKD